MDIHNILQNFQTVNTALAHKVAYRQLTDPVKKQNKTKQTKSKTTNTLVWPAIFGDAQ